MTENDSIFYGDWINDLLNAVEALREDKRELKLRVQQLEQQLAEYGNKISNLIQQRGDE